MAVVLLAGLVLWLATSAAVAWKFTHRRSPLVREPVPTVAWGSIEEHRLTTADGQQLEAWLTRGDKRTPCVLLLHGVGASCSQLLQVMQWLAESHHTVLAITFRAHGDSTGETNDFGWSGRQDVVAAVEYLRRECPGRPIFIVGRSMGAAAAIFAAKELGAHVAGYFLEQPYKDLGSAAWNRLDNELPPVLSWIAYAGLRLWSPLFLSVSYHQISPYERISDIPEGVPIIITSGTADRHARPEEVAEIFQRVESHATLVMFPGAVHEALDSNDPELYRQSLFRLLDGNWQAARGN